MEQVPLPKGVTGLKDFPKLQEYLINLMPSEGGIIRTPGIESFGSSSGACRGAIHWSVDNKRYQVCGNKFERVNSDGTVDVLGEIPGRSDVRFSAGQISLVVIVIDGPGYWYNPDSGFNQITDVDYQPSSDVDFIDGKHVFVPADGSPIFYTNIDNASVIEGLSFFDAEELPDKNRSVINVGNVLLVGGDNSYEQFVTDPDPDIGFRRRTGARIDIGHLSGKVRFGNTFAFIGRRRGEGFRFYVMASGDAIPVSNGAIDELINEEYTQDDLELTIGERFEYKGQECCVFHLTKHTLLFTMGEWIYLDSDIDGQLGVWKAKGITRSYGSYICGDRATNQLGKITSTRQQYGADFSFQFQTFIRSQRDSYFAISKIELDCLTGRDSARQQIGLSIRRDGRPWSDVFYQSLGDYSEYQLVVKWQPPGGIGLFESYAGVRVRSTADASFSLEAMRFG